MPGGPGYVGLCSNSHYGKNGNYADQVYCESPDGITWTEASFAGLQNAKGEHLELHSVARGPQGLVLVGSRTYDVQRDLVVPAVFTSPDGRTWSESPPGGPNYEVVNGPAGFVGIAWSYAAGTSVMQSADGVSWRESDLDGSGSAGYGPAAELSATSAAYFIGVGSGIPGFPHPGLYRSVDGLHWVQVNSEGARVVEAPDGSLLSQIPGLPNPVNYILTRSVDGGATWEPVDVQVTGMTLDEDDSAIRELMRVGNVVLGRSHYSVLASVDGIRWQVASPSAITDNAFWLVPLGDAIRLDIGEDEVWIGKPQ